MEVDGKIKAEPKYKIGQNNEFIIENYNLAKAFSSFLPGIAGVNGIPMWTFYVNRSQGVCSFGVENKEHSALEFLPANFAYQLVGTQGFRTFIKTPVKNKMDVYEFFKTPDLRDSYIIKQNMIITPYSLSFEEINEKLGLYITVKYCNIVNESFPALIRKVEIKNISTKSINFELLDGLACIIPYGMDDFNLKKMRYLVKSFGIVENLENKIPYLHVKTMQEDSPFVVKVKKGHMVVYYSIEKGKTKLMRPCVDPSLIFGVREDLSVPMEFVNRDNYKYDLKAEITEGKLPCAMGFDKKELSCGEAAEYCFICGTVDSIKDVEPTSKKMMDPGFFNKQMKSSEVSVESIMSNSLTLSADRKFNRYTGQNFLDNVLRGGLPVTISEKKKSVFHIYSRRHGDLERDYNQYFIEATPYSQGDGNYRDVNQNRRSDVFFNPDTQMTNIVNFLNLIQIDGFNPLAVTKLAYIFKGSDKTLREILGTSINEETKKFFDREFTPGELVQWYWNASSKPEISEKEFLSRIIDESEAVRSSEHGDGFWCDHWLYNMDLIENYLSIYPDRKKELFIGNKEFTFYDNTRYVRAREDKYVVWEGHPLQMGAVKQDDEKNEIISSRKSDKNILRTGNGKGPAYKTNLFTKLLILALNKVNSIGPDGSGIEMESDKPGWYDALNGLPGMFGSSVNETFEVKYIIQMLLDTIKELNPGKGFSFEIPEEVESFLKSSEKEIKETLRKKTAPYTVWDRLTALKEDFREKTRLGISGNMVKMSSDRIVSFLNTALERINGAIRNSFDKKTGLYHTYYANIPVKYNIIKGPGGKEKLNEKGLYCIKVKEFRSRPLPHFLEGQVHALKVEKNKAAKIHEAVMKSDLYDRKLKMFFVNGSLEKEPLDIGRARTFTPGWLENQSIWLHMEYKYLLELMKSGLYEDYFENIKNALVPYLKPEVYGRSIFENSSFIASSVHPDKCIHGNGFYARLSGSTAEFVNMWILMFVGNKPYFADKSGKLCFRVKPVLKKEYFLKKDERISYHSPEGELKEETLKKGTLRFMLHGKIPVTYINTLNRDTFGDKGVKPSKYEIKLNDGKVVEFNGFVTGPYSHLIRERIVSEITVYLK